MRGRCIERQGLPLPEDKLLPPAVLLAQVARRRSAALLDEGQVTSPADHFGIDLERGQGHLTRGELVVEGEPIADPAQHPVPRGKRERTRFRQRGSHRREQRFGQRNVERLRHVDARFAVHVFVEQRQAEEVAAPRRSPGWRRAGPASPPGPRPDRRASRQGRASRAATASRARHGSSRTARRPAAGARRDVHDRDRRRFPARAAGCGRSSSPGTSRRARLPRAAD